MLCENKKSILKYNIYIKDERYIDSNTSLSQLNEILNNLYNTNIVKISNTKNSIQLNNQKIYLFFYFNFHK